MIFFLSLLTDIKKLYRLTGVDNKPTVFLFSDTQITDKSFLEDINNILSSGEVPNLYKQDEFVEVCVILKFFLFFHSISFKNNHLSLSSLYFFCLFAYLYIFWGQQGTHRWFKSTQFQPQCNEKNNVMSTQLLYSFDINFLECIDSIKTPIYSKHYPCVFSVMCINI